MQQVMMSMPSVTAHIIDVAPQDPIAIGSLLFAAAAIGFLGWLTLQHHVVKHGGVHWRSLRRSAFGGLALVLAAGLAPSVADGQDRTIPTGLPDLISEPPIIWFERIIEDDNGQHDLVLAFDGYLHNIGDGMLDLYGDPQVPGGMRQRIFDGEEWVEVGDSNVIYETTDGHNHFHLIAAAEYELWDEARLTKIGDSAKVGFCLVDTEQLEERMDAFYDIDDFAYCQQNNPGATELRMGISPGWVDTYDANTTLQWVDVSDVRPGRYWVAAYMDPNDEIVESDEENNGIVFSRNVWPVPGWVARPLPTQFAGEPIELKADPYGQVGTVVYRIIDGPEHGTLSVPIGVDLHAESVIYQPEAGYSGTDRFTYVAADIASSYPRNPTPVTVEIDATDYDGADGQAPGDDGPVVTDQLDRIDGSLFIGFEAMAGSSDEATQWFARGLPAGLMIDESTGQISGVPTQPGDGVTTVLAIGNGGATTIEIPWSIVEPEFEDRPELDSVADFSTLRDENLNLYIGRGTEEAVYTATGLPEGVRMVSNIPLISGEPTESGTFDIEVVETTDGVETNRASFTWTVRPRPVPAFPL